MSDKRTYMNSIVGNSSLCAALCRDIASSSLSHAYIIEGAPGSGRSTIALLSAAASACEHRADGSYPSPCMSCASCRKILERKSPDVIVVDTDGKASLGVDMARFIKEDVYITPNDLEDKFYIIKDADKMTVQAQNAILLTLEEPPSFVHFFLICENSASLLETIRSRAPTLRTQALTNQEISDYICSHDKRANEMYELNRRDFDELLTAADGSIGRALALLDTKSFSAIKDTRSFAKSFIEAAIVRSSPKTVLPLISSFSSKRDVFASQLANISLALRDLILLKKTDSAPLKFYSDRDSALDLCDRVSSKRLFALQDAITTAEDENKRNANLKLVCMKLALSAELI